MKKINNIICIVLALVSLSLVSCEDQSLDLKQNVTGSPTKVSLSDGGGLIVIGGDTTLYQKDNEKIVVPMKITLAAPAAKAFRVALKVDKEKLASLLTSDTSLAGVKAMNDKFYSVDPDVMVPMGSRTADFQLTINISALEFDYNSEQAVAVSISDPTKGNSIEDSKSYVVALFKPGEIFGASTIRKVGFELGGTTELLPKNKARNNYIQTNIDEITVPVKIKLSGAATKFVNIDIVRDDQYIDNLIQNGTLTNTLKLDSTEVYMPLHPQLPNYKNEITVNLKITMFKFKENYFKKRAVAFTISYVSRHQIDPAKKTVVFVVDPQYFMGYDLSSLIKNRQTPMKWTVRENNNTGRWGILQDWTVNDAIKNRNQGMGGWSTDSGESMTVEAWGESEPNIIDGKIYQTLNLEPGTYRLGYENGYQNLFDKSYVLAIAGTSFPNVEDVPTSALGYTQMENCNCGGKSGSLFFTVAQAGPVSIGVATTMIHNDQKFELKKFTLEIAKKDFPN